jgi:N-acetyl sugar amidotransferase
MDNIKKPNPIDRAEFEKDAATAEPKFGLPEEVQFCKRCVLSNQKPNSAVEFNTTSHSAKDTILFDSEEICDACRHTEMKESTDWSERQRELGDLCDRYRRTDGRYDCIVPGSGGKDSFFAAHILKAEYDMHPLTLTWAPHIYTEWGWRNFQKWMHAGFDNVLFTPNGRVHRLLTRLALEVLFHPFQPFIVGQKNIAPKYSALYDIPLVFYGESEAEYGSPRVGEDVAIRDWSYFTADKKSSIYFGGVAFSDILENFGFGISEFDAYMPVNPETLKKVGTEVHYLGYYLKWHPQSAYYYSVEHGDFEPSPERTAGTYSKYSSIDDRVDDFHYFTTFIKFGLGRATFDASQEIRCGDIERDEGVALVHRYDGEYPNRFENELFEYLTIDKKTFPEAFSMFDHPVMDREYFFELVDSFRSPHLWKYENGAWTLRHRVENLD